MTVFILLYIMICHKLELGVMWYDWLLLGLVTLATLVEVSLKRKVAKEMMAVGESEEQESYFKDLFSTKEKK